MHVNTCIFQISKQFIQDFTNEVADATERFMRVTGKLDFDMNLFLKSNKVPHSSILLFPKIHFLYDHVLSSF